MLAVKINRGRQALEKQLQVGDKQVKDKCSAWSEMIMDGIKRLDLVINFDDMR